MKTHLGILLALLACLGLFAQETPSAPEKPKSHAVKKAGTGKKASPGKKAAQGKKGAPGKKAAKLKLPPKSEDWQPGPGDSWFIHFDEALAQAKKEKKCLFLLNTGSDWCKFCMKLHEEVLEKEKFTEFAGKKLVLVYLDSPKETPLPKEQAQHNSAVQQAYFAKSNGVPCAVILSPSGKVLGSINGYQDENKYLAQLKKLAAGKSQKAVKNKTEDPQKDKEEVKKQPQKKSPKNKAKKAKPKKNEEDK